MANELPAHLKAHNHSSGRGRVKRPLDRVVIGLAVRTPRATVSKVHEPAGDFGGDRGRGECQASLAVADRSDEVSALGVSGGERVQRSGVGPIGEFAGARRVGQRLLSATWAPALSG